MVFLRLLSRPILSSSPKKRPVAGESDTACRRNASAIVPVSLLSSCAPNAGAGRDNMIEEPDRRDTAGRFRSRRAPNGVDRERDREFEFSFLQRRVSCEPGRSVAAYGAKPITPDGRDPGHRPREGGSHCVKATPFGRTSREWRVPTWCRSVPAWCQLLGTVHGMSRLFRSFPVAIGSHRLLERPTKSIV